jgi:hypothetical protein
MRHQSPSPPQSRPSPQVQRATPSPSWDSCANACHVARIPTRHCAGIGPSDPSETPEPSARRSHRSVRPWPTARRDPETSTRPPRTPTEPTWAFEWLLEEPWDERGDVVVYEYKAADIRPARTRLPPPRRRRRRESHQHVHYQQHGVCGFSNFMSTRDPLTSLDDSVLTRCPYLEFSLSCPLLRRRSSTTRHPWHAHLAPRLSFSHVTRGRWSIRFKHCLAATVFMASRQVRVCFGSELMQEARSSRLRVRPGFWGPSALLPVD